MVEKKSDPQGAPIQPESTESGLIIETKRYEDLFTPSPLEEAFDTEIQRRFHTALLEPGIDEYGRLIRVSYPVITGDSLIAFQYTRHDLLNGDAEDIARMLLPHNPSIRKSMGDIEDIEHVDQGEWLDKVESIMEQEERVLDAIKQRIIDKDGAIDPRRAVSDPSYYTEGDEIEQWPENFKFAIFDRSNMFPYHVSPSQIERNGKLAGRRASVYGTFFIPARFRGEDHPLKERKVHLIVWFPQLDYETVRAYLKAFEGKNPEDFKRGGLDVEDYHSLGLRPKIEIPLFDFHSPKKLQEAIVKIGNFVSELTHQGKQM